MATGVIDKVATVPLHTFAGIPVKGISAKLVTGDVFTVMVTLTHVVLLQAPSARTKYVVVIVGDTLMLAPVPTAAPPQLPLYHFHVAPVPKLPPLTVKLVELPVQMLLNGASDVADVGAVDGAETVTVKLHVDVFPFTSVAILFTVVVPGGNVLPDAGVLTTDKIEQLSVAPKLKDTSGLPGSQTEIFAGHVIKGFSVSVTITSNEQSTVPHELLAVTVTVVVPTLKAEPLPSPFPLPVVAPANTYVISGVGTPVLDVL